MLPIPTVQLTGPLFTLPSLTLFRSHKTLVNLLKPTTTTTTAAAQQQRSSSSAGFKFSVKALQLAIERNTRNMFDRAAGMSRS